MPRPLLSHSSFRDLHRPRRQSSGVALIIVLAFVVLLTGLVVAFFARSMNERQVSNSSASQSKVDIFAQGAMNTIIGDLQQEIVLGSSTTSITTGTVTTTLYLPNTPANAVPALVGSSGSNGFQNLVKRSANGLAFSPNGPAACAIACSTTGTSQNGRFISPARWNKPLLLPATSGSDNTPASSYTPPDWILVARNGSNPTPASYVPTLAWSATNPTTIVGRYAYAIYDEGGLLDVNAAGYPSTTNASQSAYKPALPYADLTQIGLTQTQSDQIVAWRNWASTQATGASFTSPGFTVASGTSYYNFVTTNPTGFLTASSTAFNNGQTDRMFTSRQLLINFLQNGVGLSGTNLQNTLLYLTTFSRGINQPSLVPALTYNSTAPTILPWLATNSSGGNNAYGGDASSLVTASGDGRINPTFLAVRVKTPFIRNDGSQASVGDPLVKSRFNLNRLAWLTYLGPSATRNITNPASSGQDADMYTVENSYGISQSWLQQGTAANVQKYFGLTWGANPDNAAQNCWTYVHTSGTSSPINSLNMVAQLTGTNAREPDFFELLKASINAGALGKSGATKNSVTAPYAAQFTTDSSVDYQILQIGANIIDQYDADGYPTTIHWTNTGNTQDFVGIENLPQLYRLRAMVITARMPSPATWTQSVYLNTGANTLLDTGVAILLWLPEIWNMHDWNPNNLDQTLGNPAPTNFQIFAQDPIPTDYCTLVPVAYVTESGTNHNYSTTSADRTLSLNYPHDLAPTTGTLGLSLQRQLTHANSAMTFNVTHDPTGVALFREPTILFKAGKPAGSSLAAPGLKSLMSGSYPSLTLFQDANGDGGIMRDNSNPNLKDTVLTDPLTQGYIGFYMGATPIRWVISNLALPATSTNVITVASGSASYVFGAPRNLGIQNYFPTVQMQYQDPSGNWDTYDTKYCDSTYANDMYYDGPQYGFFNPSVGWLNCVAAFEPRCNRFCSISHRSNQGGMSPQSGTTSGTAGGWISMADGTLASLREGMSSGYPITWPVNLTMQNQGWLFPTSIGWYPGQSVFTSGNGGICFRQGLFEQNNPNVIDDAKNYDSGGAATSSGANYYSDADGVVRRAAGAWVGPNGTTPASTTVGLPLATANSGSPLTRNAAQSASRPMVLNRPFRSVADLGYVFSGTPFKNLDFFTPESGYAGLLDVFCVDDTDNANSLVAGKVSLNTRQAPVLQAILAGAYKDERNAAGSTIPGGAASLAANIANALVTRTTNGPTTGPLANQPQPLRNVSELVGKWASQVNAAGGGIDGSNSYDGFSADLSTVLTSGTDTNIQRFRESSMRALANCGQTRVWNLMIDLVAQTGRYPQSAGNLNQFLVEGEQRYWVHVAIDRLTGQVIDKQIEVVKE
jgi:Tfp pilus assembly protein PilX